MKYGYTETRTITMSELRALCIKEEWYTDGTNEEYSNLLKMTVNNNITTDDIVEMATDIIEHSEETVEKYRVCGGLDIDEIYAHVMFLIAEACTTCFEKI